MNQPRYRKSTPSNTRAFKSPEDREKFLEENKKAGEELLGTLKRILPSDFKSTNNLNNEQRKMIEALVIKCTKFCPHIDTLVMPKIKHLIVPAIKTIFCYECAPEFMALVMKNSGSDCDLCGKINVNFVEFSSALGYGLLTANLGTTCCASKMNGVVYED